MESGLEIVSQSPKALVLHAAPDTRLGMIILGAGLAVEVLSLLVCWWILPRLRGFLPLLSVPFSLIWLVGGAFFLTGSSTATFLTNAGVVRIEQRRLVFRTSEERPLAQISGARVERTPWGGKAITLVGTSGDSILAGGSDDEGYDEAVAAIGRQLALR